AGERILLEVDFHQYWLRLKQDGLPVAELEQYSFACMAARLNRFDLPSTDSRQLASTFGYAYQFDATLFAPYLRALAEGLGARRTEGKVVAVDRDGESGDIKSIRMESGEIIEGDLFVD